MRQAFYVLELNKELIINRDDEENILENAQSSENIINSFDVIVREVSIARYQAAAKDLRFLTMIIDFSRLLKGMGDLLKANLKLIKSISFSFLLF